MTKRVFEDLKEGLKETLAYARGAKGDYKIHIPREVDVRGIRKALKLTQQEFAVKFGFSVGRIRDWEQGITAPEPPLRAYLKVIEKRPDAVEDALAPVA